MPKRHPNGYFSYLGRLRELPFVAEVNLHEAAEDALPKSFADRMRERRGIYIRSTDHVATLKLVDGNRIRFRIASWLPDNLSDLSTPSPPDLPWLLMMPTINAKLADQLQEKGIAFIDKEGNCHLRIGDRYLARVQRPLPRTQVIAKRTAMRAPGYQVLYSLLADWSLLGKSQRDIAAAAGTSKQPVSDLLRALVHEGMAHKRRRTHVWATYTASREPGPNGELLDRWVAGYRDSLRPKLVVGRFRLPPPVAGQELDGTIEGLLQDRAAFYFSGTAGGQRLVPYYRGPLTVVHLGPPEETVRRLLRAMPSSDGDLVWLRHMREADARMEPASLAVALPSPSASAEPRLLPAHTANPLLVYAELMSDPDPRAREAAGLVREEWLPWSL